MTHVSCEGCRHNLGGGQCGESIEAECREGGGFQGWEPKTDFRDAVEMALYRDRYMAASKGFMWSKNRVRWDT